MVWLEICIDAGILSQKWYRKLDIWILVSCNWRKLDSTMCALKKWGSGILIDGVHTLATGAVTREENQDLFSVWKQWKTTIIRPNQLHPWLPLEIWWTIDPDYHEEPLGHYQTVIPRYI